MKISMIRSYKSTKGNTVFVYEVNGTTAELAAYEESQGEFHTVADNGKPLFFTTKCAGQSGKLIITTNGKAVVDMSDFDQAASLASQYGGNLGEELAKSAAQMLLGHKAPSAPVANTTPEHVEDNEDLNDL